MIRKQRTRSHIIADLSVNHVERHALLCGHAVERVVKDYGVDLILWMFDTNGEIESGQVFVQLKATDNLPLLADNETIAFALERRDLNYWLSEVMPCILVVYDAVEEVGYWLYLQQYFAALPEFDITRMGETITVHLSKSQSLDTDAVHAFQKMKYRVREQTEGVRYLNG